MRTLLLLLMFFGLSSFYLVGEENFILIHGNTSATILEFGPNLSERVTPACSFNIALSLMAYDAGVLKDEKTPILEFQEGYDDQSDAWKTSQTPQSWMTRSCVWYSKLTALKLGLEAIQQYLILFEYGNQDMSAGLANPGPMKPAWVSSSLKISPKEQVEFIQKMIHGKFPISTNAIHMTKALLFKEELSGGWKLYGKTGGGTTDQQDGSHLKVTWFVGWIENGNTFFPFAYQMREIDFYHQPIPRVKQLLKHLVQ